MELDLTKFERSLPYASELFGVYQPLLGWKSRRIRRRFTGGLRTANLALVEGLAQRLTADAKVHISDFTVDDVHFAIEKLGVATMRSGRAPAVPGALTSYVTELAAQRLSGASPDDDAIWETVAGPDALAELLHEAGAMVQTNRHDVLDAALTEDERAGLSEVPDRVKGVLEARLDREAVVAGVLAQLFATEQFGVLRELFFPPAVALDSRSVDRLNELVDPMEHFNAKTDIGLVSLSPVGIIHLFRQYFFEFDTFLGTPVQHAWLSPGSSLELVEIHTRKQIVERTIESSIETIAKSEKSTTEQDELSDAVRDENQANTKFGFNAGGGVSGGVPGVYSATGHIDTTTNYGLESTQKTAREATHKHMRQQTDKLSNEIRQNFRSTFRTLTEEQDTSSRRDVLQNTTNALLNYELRRKMRQVGVQVQDIGTQLCWQTYVDLPGTDLGLANLVHIGAPPDLSGLPHPQQPAMPEPISKDYTAKLFFRGLRGDNDTNHTYVARAAPPAPDSDDGWAVTDGAGRDVIHMNYVDRQVEAIPGYDLEQVVFVGCVEGKQV